MNIYQSNERIFGLDLARALAVIGMILVNYKLAMNAQDAGPVWLQKVTEALEGRASALFVILAGIGVSLMTAKARASGVRELILTAQKTLYRRAAFLFVTGMLLLAIGWSADILHYYAVFLAVAALLLQSTDRKFLLGAAGILVVTIFQLLFLDYSIGWSANYHEYENVWTLSGFTRNLLFNGFHPVFPWLAFFLLGMWLGRKDWLTRKKARTRLLLIAAAAAVFMEMVSRYMMKGLTPLLSSEGARYLFGTKPMPPNLMYFFAAAASALTVLMICIQAAERWRESRWVQTFIRTGQLSLTHYVAHIMVGLAPLQLTGLLENGSIVFSTIYAFIFYAAAAVFSFYWKNHHSRGPLEQLMRRWE
ncbi:heparan-alpha-glucosaminide N-acetyltransferase domain-containing protein [Paenibacillus sp. AN1007]|uniref:Heparan-alpha-glucosaminide N-acetyltransferase domain-containing protein n=1 Tax=Paenibacillus sp. AN1007 TaxID=3151385 RepID=A0AAU8NL61_9BACL